MKKSIVFFTAVLFALPAISQNIKDILGDTGNNNILYVRPPQTKKVTAPINAYTSLNLSLTNQQGSSIKYFPKTSYPSLENGIMYQNLGAGIVLGRDMLYNIGSNNDNISDYYYELKGFATLPIGCLTGTVLLGWGEFFDDNNPFVEYGIGISYSVKKFGFGLTYSNWAGVNYVTPGITYNY